MATFLIVKVRTWNLRKMITDATQTRSFAKLEDLSSSTLISAIGHAFPFLDDDFSVLDWAVTARPEDYNLTLIYCTFCILRHKNLNKIDQLVSKLHDLTGSTLPRQIKTGFIELLMLQHESQDSTKSLQAMCSSTTDNYMSVLQLFWTEVLLGQDMRLASLAMLVNEAFHRTLTFFSLVGASDKADDYFKRFSAITSVKVTTPALEMDNTLFEVLFEQPYDVVLCSEKMIDHITKPFTYEPSMASTHIAGHQEKSRRKIKVISLLMLTIPYIFAVILIPLMIEHIVLYVKKPLPAWELFHQMTNIIMRYSNAIMLHPLVAIDEFGATNLSAKLFDNVLVNSMFPSGLTTPRLDLIYNIDALLADVYSFASKIEDSKFIDIFAPFINEMHVVNIVAANSTVTRQAPTVTYMVMNVADFQKEAQLPPSTYLEHFNQNFSYFIPQTSREIIDYMINFSEVFINDFRDEVVEATEYNSRIINDLANVIMVVGIIIVVSLVFVLKHAYAELFAPLFVLPKVAISERLDVLNQHISQKRFKSDSKQADIKFNLQQLSYEQPSSGIPTTNVLFIRAVLVSVFLLVVFRVLFLPAVLTTTSMTKTSLDTLIGTRGDIIMSSYAFDIGQAFFMLLLDEQAGLVEETADWIERLNNLAIYAQENYLHDVLTPLDFPFVNSDTFIYRTGECLNDNAERHIFKCYSYSGRIISATTQVLDILMRLEVVHTVDNIDDAYVDNLMITILSFVSNMIPNTYDTIFESAYNYSFEAICILVFLVMFFIFVAVLAFMAFRNVINKVYFDAKYATPIFGSVPIGAIPTFHQYIGANDNNIIAHGNEEAAASIFERDDVFSILIDPFILVNAENEIIQMSPTTRTLFGLEQDDKVGTSIVDFLHSVSNSPIEAKLPPHTSLIFDFVYVTKDGAKLLLNSHMIPVKKVNVLEQQVAYVCVIEDITVLNSLISTLNHEANRVRLLTAQLAPEPILPSFLGNIPFSTMMPTRLTFMRVIIYAHNDGLSLKEVMFAQEMVRKTLADCPNATYFGRSIQTFRVIVGLSNPNSGPDQAAEAVRIGLSFVDDIKNFDATLHAPEEPRRINIRIGIHTAGPFMADLVSELPLAFDVFGGQLTPADFAAAMTEPNEVTVTRDIRQAIFDNHSFTVGFENEIPYLDGNVQQVYKVRAATITGL